MRLLNITLLAMSLFSLFSCGAQKRAEVLPSVPESKLELYSFSSHGSMRGSQVCYSLENRDGSICVTTETGEKGMNHHKSSKTYKVSDLANRISYLLMRDDAFEWPRNFVSEVMVHDGVQWSSTIIYDGETYSSGGSNAWPEGDALSVINRLIRKYSGFEPDLVFPLKEFSYKVTGTAYGDVVCWFIRRDEAGDVVVRYSRGIQEERLDNYECWERKFVASEADEVIDSIRALLDEDNVRAFEDSYVDHEVLDGYMWSTRISFEDAAVYSGGSNAWPEWPHLGDVETLIEKYSGYAESMERND